MANAVGITILVRSSSYNIWHISAKHLQKEKFTDAMTFGELRKGDILVKDEHVALVADKPVGNNVDVIEAAVKWDDGYKSKVIDNIYTRGGDGIIVRGHEPLSKNYQPRRFSPPYLKRVRVLKEDIENGVANHILTYEVEWKEGTGGKELNKIAEAIMDAGRYYIELEFSKAMAVSVTAYTGGWERILVKARSGSKEAEIKGIEDKSINRGYFNSGKKIFNGWIGQERMDIAEVFNKWVGEVDINGFAGEVGIEVDATSLMQDRLDSNPATIAERTEEGGWRKNNFQLKGMKV